MNKKPYSLQFIFHNLKFFCSGVSVLLVLFFGATLFTRTCGGGFPDRVRAPLAHEEFYKRGDLPDWEDVVHEEFDHNGRDLNRLELMIEGEPIPDLIFGEPTPTPAPEQAAEPAQETESSDPNQILDPSEIEIDQAVPQAPQP